LGVVDFLPTVKNMRNGVQILNRLGFAKERIKLILNRDGSQTHIQLKQVEDILGMAFDYVLPNDFRAAQKSIHRGIPLVLSGKGLETDPKQFVRSDSLRTDPLRNALLPLEHQPGNSSTARKIVVGAVGGNKVEMVVPKHCQHLSPLAESIRSVVHSLTGLPDGTQLGETDVAGTESSRAGHAKKKSGFLFRFMGGNKAT
jgi:hypothetical protein